MYHIDTLLDSRLRLSSVMGLVVTFLWLYSLSSD